jgi:hypothetical protein
MPSRTAPARHRPPRRHAAAHHCPPHLHTTFHARGGGPLAHNRSWMVPTPLLGGEDASHHRRPTHAQRRAARAHRGRWSSLSPVHPCSEDRSPLAAAGLPARPQPVLSGRRPVLSGHHRARTSPPVSVVRSPSPPSPHLCSLHDSLI